MWSADGLTLDNFTSRAARRRPLAGSPGSLPQDSPASAAALPRPPITQLLLSPALCHDRRAPAGCGPAEAGMGGAQSRPLEGRRRGDTTRPLRSRAIHGRPCSRQKEEQTRVTSDQKYNWPLKAQTRPLPSGALQTSQLAMTSRSMYPIHSRKELRTQDR